MATLINNKVTFSGGETLPQVGSEAYKQAQAGTLPTSSFDLPKMMSSDDLSRNVLPLKLPPVINTSDVANNIIGGATVSIAKSAEEAKRQGEIEAKQAEQANYKQDLSGILGEQAGLGARKSRLEEEANIPESRKQRDEINNQIEAKQLSIERSIQDLEKNPQGLFGGGLEQEINRIKRQGSRELADLSIIQNARNRNLLTAQTLVDQKISLETEDLKRRADNLKFFYDENKQDLNKAEQRQFEQLSKQADREYNETREKVKTLEESRLKYYNDAVALGKGNDVLTKLQGAKTTGELAKIASSNGIIDLDTQLRKVQIEEKVEEIKKIKAEADQIAGKDGGNSDNLSAYANQFADTGKLPSPAELKQSGLTVGQVTTLAKQTKKPDGAVVSTNTGVKSSALSPAQEEGITAMSEIVRQILPSLKEKFPKLYTGLIGGVAGEIYTTQDRQDYLTFRQEFLNKLLKARSGATVTPQEYERYSALLPSTFNQSFFLGSDGLKKLNSLETAMKSSLDNTLNSNQVSIYGYSTVDVGGEKRKVGELLDIGGRKYRVLPDGTLTDII